VATQTRTYCDGCDVSLNPDRHHMARLTTKVPGCNTNSTDFDLCMTCFQVLTEKMKTDRWPAAILEKA
jgi:hypothetical protein